MSATMENTDMDRKATKLRRMAPLDTPTDLKTDGVREISGALNALLADVFALYLKTKNFQRNKFLL